MVMLYRNRQIDENFAIADLVLVDTTYKKDVQLYAIVKVKRLQKKSVNLYNQDWYHTWDIDAG